VIRIAIVNRFFPPDPAITGQSARELGDFLRRRIPDAAIRVYATEAEYGGGRVSSEQPQHDVRRLRSWYSGKQKLLRLAASLHDGFRLAWMASRDADIVISLTDPPLLGMWMGLLTRLRRRRWIEWTMDLYPEAFIAARLIGRGNPLNRTLNAVLRKFAPERYICLGPGQHAFLQKMRSTETPAFILPCGIFDPHSSPAPDWRRKYSDKIIAAYAGNLGEAHSADVLADFVLRADRSRIAFLLAPYGSKAQELRRRLAGIDGIEWRDNVPLADLAHADVHIASLTSEWTHVCVPSKAFSSVCLGRPIVFAGIPQADSWSLLREASWLIPEQPDGSYAAADIARVADELLDPTALGNKTGSAVALRARLVDLRERAYTEIVDACVAGRSCRPADRRVRDWV